jgi:DNA modification methylase
MTPTTEPTESNGLSENYQLHLGDCAKVMETIKSASVDLILCDLPYGMTENLWDSVIPFYPLWKQYKRIIKPKGAIVLNASQPFASSLVLSNPKWFRYEWIWHKTAATGFLNARKRPLVAHENILVFASGQTTYNPQGAILTSKIVRRGSGSTNYGPCNNSNPATGENYPRSVQAFPVNRERHGHPTAKPVAMCEYIIRTYTDPGELVLDNCMGSGTTGVAAVNTGRRFVGIEKDPIYFATAKDRIDKALALSLANSEALEGTSSLSDQ